MSPKVFSVNRAALFSPDINADAQVAHVVFAVSAYFQGTYPISVHFLPIFSRYAMGLKFLKMGLPFRTNRIGIKISKVPLFVISA